MGIGSERLKFASSSNVYEDNNIALVLATSTAMTNTSKHIAVKFHWFRKHIGKEFLIQEIKSEIKRQIFSPNFYTVKYL